MLNQCPAEAMVLEHPSLTITHIVLRVSVLTIEFLRNSSWTGKFA